MLARGETLLSQRAVYVVEVREVTLMMFMTKGMACRRSMGMLRSS